jgi:hypothetical protein
MGGMEWSDKWLNWNRGVVGSFSLHMQAFLRDVLMHQIDGFVPCHIDPDVMFHFTRALQDRKT